MPSTCVCARGRSGAGSSEGGGARAGGRLGAGSWTGRQSRLCCVAVRTQIDGPRHTAPAPPALQTRTAKYTPPKPTHTLTRMPAPLSAAVSWSTAASTALRSVSFFTIGTTTTCGAWAARVTGAVCCQAAVSRAQTRPRQQRVACCPVASLVRAFLQAPHSHARRHAPGWVRCLVAGAGPCRRRAS